MTTAPAQERPAASALHLTAASQRVPELDGLRGLAILLVLLCHYIADSDSSGLPIILHRALRSFSLGWTGVDLFFVLSGFLIGGILLESKESPRYFRTFYLRRVHRILPIYYGWILLYCAFVLALRLFDSGYHSAVSDLRPIPIYLLFVQNFFYSKQPLEFIWFGATWSLAIEEQFYLGAPMLIRKLSKKQLKVALLAVIVISPLLRLFFYLLGPGYYLFSALSTFCRADELAIGVLIVLLWRDPEVRHSLVERPQILNRWLLVLTLALCSLLYWFWFGRNWWSNTIGFSVVAGWFAALLLLTLSRPLTRTAWFFRLKPLRALGLISYCVYIIHYPVLAALHQMFLHGPPQINTVAGVAVTVAALAVTFGLASLSWRFLEKPLIRRGHRYAY